MLVAKNFSDIVTFARASSGTFVGSDGLVKVAGNNQARLDFDPVTLARRGLMVEEQRTNLLTYSPFVLGHAGGWTQSLASISANTALAPDGTFSASTLIPDTSSNSHVIYWGASFGSGTFTFSVCAKAAGYPRLGMRVYDGAAYQIYTTFDISAGTVVSVVAGTASITSLGNGWYLCSCTGTSPTGSMGTVAGWAIESLPSGVTVQSSFVGNGSSGAHIWGPQVEAGAFRTSLILSSITFTGRTSTATFIGSNGLIQTAASGVARQQYNPLNLSAAPFLLLEEQRTNRLLRSQEFDNAAWGKTNATVTAAQGTAPDGTNTVAKIVYSGGVASYERVIEQNPGTQTAGTRITFSLWMRGENGGESIELVDRWGGGTTFTLTNTLTRYSVTFSANGTSNNFYLQSPNNNTTIYVWGAQAEVGGYVTSYIPTTTAQVTRAADTSTSAQTTRSADEASVNTLSPWFSASAGTIYVEASIPASASTRGPVRFDDGTANNRLMIRDGGATRIDGRVISGGTSVANLESAATAFTANTTFKAALAYAANDFALSFNGGAALTDTAGALPSAISRLLIGDANASNTDKGALIRRITYYPRRMSNAELQTLTA